MIRALLRALARLIAPFRPAPRTRAEVWAAHAWREPLRQPPNTGAANGSR
jgi:hypothetical protein